jgi:2-methylfumaryl-CoA isomerase
MASTENEMSELVEHPGVGPTRRPARPWTSPPPRVPVRLAPQLGEHTEAVLPDLFGMTTTETGRLERGGVVRCARR